MDIYSKFRYDLEIDKVQRKLITVRNGMKANPEDKKLMVKKKGLIKQLKGL